jgi:hypothetical protein
MAVQSVQDAGGGLSLRQPTTQSVSGAVNFYQVTGCALQGGSRHSSARPPFPAMARSVNLPYSDSGCGVGMGMDRLSLTSAGSQDSRAGLCSRCVRQTHPHPPARHCLTNPHNPAQR